MLNSLDKKIEKFLKRMDFNDLHDFDKQFIEVEAGKTISIFFYEGNKNAHTEFYFIAEVISEKDKYFVERYVWNKSDAEVYFLPQENDVKLLLVGEPNSKEDREIESFNYKEEDEERLKRINKKEFDKGTFWLKFGDFLDKIKRSNVNSKLIETLQDLRKSLLNEYNENLSHIDNRKELVQALIDRTLFIKFLEDNHIINSAFYGKFYKDKNLNYKKLLEERRIKDINLLYEKINLIFSNSLFQTPEITEDKWSYTICLLLKNAISQQDFKTGQLSLFDFDFSVMPVEFIGHIYEAFEEKTKRSNAGIFYTPKGLAKLIVSDVIGSKIGTVLDPACGSGMFLITAFRKLVENHNLSKELTTKELIETKNRILRDYIFGIEKESSARRLSLFSLYLAMLDGIKSENIKNHIIEKINTEDNLTVFPYNFESNILEANSLEIKEKNIPHFNKTFDFIVGNPPFFRIKPNQEESNFIKKYDTEIENEKIIVKNIIGRDFQISQCFMLKIKDWAKQSTRFGFVLNYSNFINEKSNNFRKFFFQYYQVERFYELSEAKTFESAAENVCTIIFNNQPISNNNIEYLKVEENEFSKIFKITILQEDNTIKISQKDILEGKITLRDYLFANEYDLNLLNNLEQNTKELREYLSKNPNYTSFRGMEITGQDAVVNENNITISDYKILDEIQQQQLKKGFQNKYTRTKSDDTFSIPCLKPKNIEEYIIGKDVDYFLENFDNETDEQARLDKFSRGRNNYLYTDFKILINRTGTNIKALFSKDKLYFNFDVYGIKLNKTSFLFGEVTAYKLFTAILNSDLVNYFLRMKELMRSGNSFPKYNAESIKKIPIPKNLDEDLIEEIAQLSQEFSEGKQEYKGEAKKRMNHLIGDLYDLNILDKIRIEEFLYDNKNRKLKIVELEKGYCEAMKETLFLYYPKLQTQVHEGRNLPFNLICVALYLDENQPTSQRFLEEIIDEIIEKSNAGEFLFVNKMYVAKKVIYIIKENQFKNWTETKAFEDGQEILTKYVTLTSEI